jgi:hypothetical protein
MRLVRSIQWDSSGMECTGQSRRDAMVSRLNILQENQLFAEKKKRKKEGKKADKIRKYPQRSYPFLG